MIENPLVNEWLAEKKSQSTRDTYLYKFRMFLDYFGITPEQLLEMGSKQSRALALRFQNEQPEKPHNTILSHLTAVSSFLEHHDKPIRWKRARVKPSPDVSSHVFSNGDLNRMFQVGDARDKAILALTTSLGWEISGFVKLRRKKVAELVERAEETQEQFIYFENIRKKTGVLRLGVINPLALKCLSKWLQISANKKVKTDKVNPVSDIFLLTDRGIQNRLKILANRADIKTTGRIRFHNIRKWTMSGLSRSGFNEFQIKFVVGKAIPLSDRTYLQTLKQEVEERYPEAYENYLNLSPTISKEAKKQIEAENRKLRERIELLESQKQERSKDIEQLKEQMASLRKQFESLMNG